MQFDEFELQWQQVVPDPFVPDPVYLKVRAQSVSIPNIFFYSNNEEMNILVWSDLDSPFIPICKMKH